MNNVHLSITPIYLEILFTFEFEYTVQSHSGVVCPMLAYTQMNADILHTQLTHTQRRHQVRGPK